MNVAYNFSEYCDQGEKEFNTNSCKAVRTPNGDLFIISNAIDETNDGKQVANIVIENCISFFNDEVFSNKQEALKNSINFAKQELEKSFDTHLAYRDIKVAISIILFENNQFHLATTGHTNISLFSEGNLYTLTKENPLLNWDVFTSRIPIKLKKDDVLIASTNELSVNLDNTVIATIFNSTESVAQKTKDLLDNVLQKGDKNNISIQTIEITKSDHLQTVFLKERAAKKTPVVVKEDSIAEEPIVVKESIAEEPIITDFADVDASSSLDQPKVMEKEKLEVETTHTAQDTFKEETQENKMDENYEEANEDNKKGFSFLKLLYVLLPLLLLFLAYKYYPLLTGDKNTDEITTVDGTTTQDGTIISTDSIPDGDNPELYPEATDPNATGTTTTTDSSTTGTTTTQNNTTTSTSYFVIGDNDFNNNTYKTIYQYMKNSGTSLSMDDIIKLNPDYRKKRDGDKIYVK